jgi:GT2 family glycosyltransferase
VLCNTITYALDQDFADYEILIVDQTEEHEKETYSFLDNLPDKAKVISHHPPSLPGARNRGIRESRGEIVIMIDDDVILKHDFISQHLKYYENKEVSGVTGKVEQKNKITKRLPFSLKNEFMEWIPISVFDDNFEKEAFRLAGGNFSVKKEYAFRAGLFDENFIGTAWGEEYDFSLRLKKVGKKLIFNPRAYIFHLNDIKGGTGNRSLFNFFSVYSKSHNLTYLIEKNRIDRKFYVYLTWYVYRQSFYKKDYLNPKGLAFILLAQFFFLKGLVDGIKSANKKKHHSKPGKV